MRAVFSFDTPLWRVGFVPSLNKPHWFENMVSEMAPPEVSLDALILCAHYGLLGGVRAREPGYYDAYLFSLSQEDDESPEVALAGWVIHYDHSLSSNERAAVTKVLEAAGCIWPGQAAVGDPAVITAWREVLNS